LSCVVVIVVVTMSVVGNNRVGIPIVLLHDAEGAVVEVETKKGELIRGILFEAEDQMNLYVKNAIIRDPNGVKRKVNQVYVRGPEIVFIVLPDMLEHAPMFNRYVFLKEVQHPLRQEEEEKRVKHFLESMCVCCLLLLLLWFV
jgi:small nuclear ribonucleoprotein D3